ncbi:MAG: MarC family protein [Pseudomonadota bacterium]
MEGLGGQFLTLWAVIDPIGTLPVFMAVAAGYEPKRQRILAVKAFAVATGVLLLFIVAGQFALEALGISLVAFQIAGGIVLLLFALTMIFGDSKIDDDIGARERGDDAAVFPLAIPSLASPGAMLAVVLLTDNHRFDLAEQAVTTGLMLGVMAASLAVMLAATPLNRLIGKSGAAIVSRVMGMLLASVAVDNVLGAFATLGVLPQAI